jgi:hypothetical protein
VEEQDIIIYSFFLTNSWGSWVGFPLLTQGWDNHHEIHAAMLSSKTSSDGKTFSKAYPQNNFATSSKGTIQRNRIQPHWTQVDGRSDQETRGPRPRDVATLQRHQTLFRSTTTSPRRNVP